MQLKWLLQGGEILVKLGMLLLLVYLLVCAYLYLNQRSMLFFRGNAMLTPEQASVMTLQNAGANLKIWQIHPQQADAIIYFGGNAENVGGSIAAFAHHFGQHSVYLANYRGYAGSSGDPSEAALFEDALALFDHVSSQHRKVLVIGRSLGSGVAVYLATQRKIEKLVLVTPYDSVENVASNLFPVFPVRFLLKDKFNSLPRAQQIQVPTLMLLAQHDTVVPHPHSQQLFAALATSSKTSQLFPATDHNSIIEDASYWQRLQQFFAVSGIK